MKMNKMFAGLVAFAAGLALSAGSALATNGYVGGDFAMMKLVPYYETGDTKATIIGIQNLSPQQMATMNANNLVSAIMVFLDGKALAATVPGSVAALARINFEYSGATVDANTVLGASQLELRAAAEAALGKAQAETYTEHVYVTVNVHDKMGMMMGSASLCLAEHQFGYVVLQGAESMMMDTNQGMVLSVMDGDIAEYGYAEVSASGNKFTGCGGSGPVSSVDTRADPSTGTATTTGADSKIATWTIIQDVGMGFFGTEVQSATISKARNAGADATDTVTGDDGAPELACYDNQDVPDTDNTAAANVTPHTSGTFAQARCGLIPERHFLLPDSTDRTMLDTTGDSATANDSSTQNANAIARYDIGDETMIYVWLGKGMDAPDAKPTERRMLDVVVKCEDGTVQMAPDRDGVRNQYIKVPAPGMLTMIDPMSMEKSMGEIGMYTGMCEGDRGVLKIMMPLNSHAGMVFSHVTQMMGHYRMNFPGYSMASPTEIDD